MRLPREKLESIGPLIEEALRRGNVPGAAIAVVVDDEVVFAEGYGYRDVSLKTPMTPKTLYPIGSTTKAMNATLLGSLVDERRMSWDKPARHYVPRLNLGDGCHLANATIRDLVAMRTGLPRHDFLWVDSAMTRPELLERITHLIPSSGFRERFQYNNLTPTVAGHIAEVIAGREWPGLVEERILQPLGMTDTLLYRPSQGDVTQSYHESQGRDLVLSRCIGAQLVAPAGGIIHSTVVDMAKWVALNLNAGRVGTREVFKPETIREIHTPVVVAGSDRVAPSPGAAYALGWFCDSYNGHPRLSHGGYLHDVNSSLMLFPIDNIGLVSFTNLGCKRLARFICQDVFDLIVGRSAADTVSQRLSQYERDVSLNLARIAATRRVVGTRPSHPLYEYVGTYADAAYGAVEIRVNDDRLTFCRNTLEFPLEHWHYDSWVVESEDVFTSIHEPHVLDRANRFVFETDRDGWIAALSIPLEPATAPILFARQ